ncbi:DNRLRE domain-containing protein [Saccharibacillus endophyticus]|uniref:DNRLRE domain-containing protein n=1 Tax=Saccharibacillus endophyticus TaxID=2060666 RepID=A0ABQ1ZYJ2_9BACL|nr:DNRLRE domain-containing protein [Saccharibacillus endophyticus]GGH82619.1 hypothetical protein GCM10007362_34210 [Saccharibacillus endophyticus]
MRAKRKWLLSTLLVSSLGAQAIPHSALAEPEPSKTPDGSQLQNAQAAADLVEAPAEVVSEEVANRTMYSKEYLLSDNSRETVLSAAPLHYEDGNGNYQDISLALTLESVLPEAKPDKAPDLPAADEPQQPTEAPEAPNADSEVEPTASGPLASVTSLALSKSAAAGTQALADSVDNKQPAGEAPSPAAPTDETPTAQQPDESLPVPETPSAEVPADESPAAPEAPTQEETPAEPGAPSEEAPPAEKPAAADPSEPGYTSSTVPYTPSLHNSYAQGFSLGVNGNFITLVPVGAQDAQADVSQASVGKLAYANVWTSTDANLALTASGISQTLNLTSADAPSTFRFALEGHLGEDLTGGGLSLTPAWLTDADGQRREVLQTLNETDGVRYLDVDIDTSGLSYPIEVKTGIELQSEVQTATITAQETGALGEMSLFARSAPKQLANRTYLQFDLSGLPENAAVREAYLTTGTGGEAGDSDTLRVLRAVEPWNAATLASSDEPRTALRADGASYGKLRTDADGTQRIDLDPDLITRWLTEEQPNYGVQIDSGSEPTSFAEAPQLHIRHGGDTVSTLSAAGTPMQFQYVYDEQSRLQYIQFSSGERINFTYDTNGNLIQRQYVPGF